MNSGLVSNSDKKTRFALTILQSVQGGSASQINAAGS
jgi:hypothetical protein